MNQTFKDILNDELKARSKFELMISKNGNLNRQIEYLKNREGTDAH